MFFTVRLRLFDDNAFLGDFHFSQEDTGMQNHSVGSPDWRISNLENLRTCIVLIQSSPFRGARSIL